MPNEQLDSLPDPTWRGFMVGSEDAFVESALHQGERRRQQRLRDLDDRSDGHKRALRDYADRMRMLREAIAAAEAEMRELKAQTADINKEVLLRDLEYIKTLPEVLGYRFENGALIVHVRTSSVYEGKRYDMGDFEVTLGTPQAHYDEVAPVYCTRTGTRKRVDDTYGGYYEHPFFHGEVRRDGTACGWFCFGHRTEQIKHLLSLGEYGQAMHLIVNSMSSVNEGKEGHYKRFTEIPLNDEKEEVEEIRPRAVLRG